MIAELLLFLPVLAEHVEEVIAEPAPAPVVVEEVNYDTVWDRLAECESGNWLDNGTSFERGSARWAWGGNDPIPPWGTAIHHGGLQFHPDTWNWVAPMVGLGHIDYAYEATREDQITVAERVLELQGWQAWPVCSRKLNLR